MNIIHFSTIGIKMADKFHLFNTILSLRLRVDKLLCYQWGTSPQKRNIAGLISYKGMGYAILTSDFTDVIWSTLTSLYPFQAFSVLST